VGAGRACCPADSDRAETHAPCALHAGLPDKPKAHGNCGNQEKQKFASLETGRPKGKLTRKRSGAKQHGVLPAAAEQEPAAEDDPPEAAAQDAPKASGRGRKPAGNHSASPRKDKAAAGPGPGDISMTPADVVAALLSVKQFQAVADPLRRSATSVGPGGSSLQVQQMQEQLETAHAACAQLKQEKEQLKQEKEQLAAAQFGNRKKLGAANNGGGAAAAGQGEPLVHPHPASSFGSASAAAPNTAASGSRLLVSMPPLTKLEAARLGEEGRRLRVAAEMERSGVVRSRAAVVRVAWNFKDSKKGARGYDVYFGHFASEIDASYALSRAASQSRMAVNAGFIAIREPNSHIRPADIASLPAQSEQYNKRADLLLLRHGLKLYIDVTVTRPTSETNCKVRATSHTPLASTKAAACIKHWKYDSIASTNSTR